MSFKVVVTSRLFMLYPLGLETLREAGGEIIQHPADSIDEDALIELLRDADATVAGIPRHTDRVMANTPRLRIISRTGVGFDNVDTQAATNRGIVVTTTPGTNENSVADTVFALLLAAARNIIPSFASVKRGEWTRIVGIEAWRKTIGIVGVGRIGRAVARRAQGFDMEILGYDVFQDHDFAASCGLKYVAMDELLRRADFISLNAPLSAETRHLINARTIALMKPTAYLINTARGDLVNEGDLYVALKERRIAGAALDVLAEEPPGNNRLFELDNVILTPHCGGWSWESIERSSRMAVQSVLDVLEGRQPPGLVNPEVYQRGVRFP